VGNRSGGGRIDFLAVPNFKKRRPASSLERAFIDDELNSLFVAIADDDILVAPISAIRLYEAWLRRKK
jgi:hypothetical protein